LLVEAFSRVAGRRDDVHLVLAGSGDADYVMRIAGMLRDHGTSDRATITGQLDDEEKLAVLRDADVFVLPSYGENFGISVVEAMACGLPVLISDKVGIWREIAEAEAGIVTTCQSEKIADAIERLLNDPGLRTALGQHGKTLVGAQGFVEKHFVTPAKAGVQKIIKGNEIINILDSGLRRNDGFECFYDFFNKLLEVPAI